MPGGVVTVGITRPETFVEAGVQLLPHMNVLHKIAFEPLDGGARANVGADFCLRDGEIQPALQKANQEGFAIHCLYNQQTSIEPNLFFSHTLKAGDPLDLARSVRRVLDVVKATPARSA